MALPAARPQLSAPTRPTFTAVDAHAPLPAHRGLCRFAVVTTVLTILLIQLGAMVTSTGSGLAYLDWPTANGSWWPAEMGEWSAGFLEHGHRTYGALIGLLILALTVWTLAVERRRAVRLLAIALLALVSIQGVIGGKGVQWGLPLWTSALHGVLAQVLLCGLTVFAFTQSRAWQERSAHAAPTVRGARNLTTLAVVAIFAQLVLGAVVRHSDLHGMLWLHITQSMVVAVVMLVASLFVGARLPRMPSLVRTARWLLAILGLQLALGLLTVIVRGGGKATASLDQLARALVITGHVVVGAVMFLLATLLCARTWRNLTPAP
jgi:heme A synthase